MAAFLDVGALQSFSIIFPFLLVFIVVYALLMWLKPLGEDKGINSIIALCVAALVLFSANAVNLIKFISPWFAIFFIFIFFLITMFRLTGTSNEAIEGVMKSWGTIHWWLLAIGLLILIGGLSEVYGPKISPLGGEANVTTAVTTNVTAQPGQPGYRQEIIQTLTHPRVLGLVLLLLIITFAIKTLTE